MHYARAVEVLQMLAGRPQIRFPWIARWVELESMQQHSPPATRDSTEEREQMLMSSGGLRMPVRKWGWKDLLKRHEPVDPTTKAWGHMIYYKKNHSNSSAKDIYQAIAAPSFASHVQVYSGYAWRSEQVQKPQVNRTPKGARMSWSKAQSDA